MKLVKVKAALASFALLAACEGDMGLKGNDSATDEQVEISAEGKAQDGRISMKGPGFDFALNVPGGLADHANVDGDNKIIYPDATISGMHIAAGDAPKRSGIELRFTSRDPLDKVAAWYRDPARADGFTLASATPDGDGIVIAGTTRNDDNDFKVRLSPKAGSGTDGRVTISDRN